MMDFKQQHWDGPYWRRWAFVGGIAMVAMTVLPAWLAATVTGQPFSAIMALGMLAELLVLSMMGSGMLSSTSRRMSRGGLARETATLDIDEQLSDQGGLDRDRQSQMRDRRTTRAGIMLLPPLLIFVYLLAR